MQRHGSTRRIYTAPNTRAYTREILEREPAPRKLRCNVAAPLTSRAARISTAGERSVCARDYSVNQRNDATSRSTHRIHTTQTHVRESACKRCTRVRYCSVNQRLDSYDATSQLHSPVGLHGYPQHTKTRARTHARGVCARGITASTSATSRHGSTHQ
jgi:hypothetical protein